MRAAISGGSRMPPSDMPVSAIAMARPRWTANHRTTSAFAVRMPAPCMAKASGTPITMAQSHTECDSPSTTRLVPISSAQPSMMGRIGEAVQHLSHDRCPDGIPDAEQDQRRVGLRPGQPEILRDREDEHTERVIRRAQQQGEDHHRDGDDVPAVIDPRAAARPAERHFVRWLGMSSAMIFVSSGENQTCSM